MLGTRRTKQASSRNLSFGEKGSVNPASLRYPEVAEDETLVPVRKVLHDFEQREGARGFITYTIFFAIYFALNSYRFDASEGRRTITWFNEALKSQYDLVADETNGWCAWDAGGLECYEPYLERADIDGLEHFLESDLTQVVSGILEYCDECLIGMSEVSKDLRDTPLSQFLCVDFETLPETAFAIGAGKATFSKRDCKKVDDEFKSSPSPLEAPCCHDASVRYASQALMATFETQGEWAAVEGLTYADLQPSKRTRKALKDYTARALENDANKNTLIQIVILRGGHATGIVFGGTFADRKFLKERVEPHVRFWSYFYDDGSVDEIMLAFMMGTWILSLVHELLEIWSSAYRPGSLLSAVLRPFMLFIEWPSIIAPILLEATHTAVELGDYVFLVSMLELLMFMRVFQEGQVVPPFALIVRTLINAGKQLVMFTIAMGASVLVLASINMQLFGNFHDGYADLGDALTSLFTSGMITGQELDDDLISYAHPEATAMHFVVNLFLFLILAQFFIAILVGAFDSTREAEEERRQDRALPEGFKRRHRPPPLSMCAHVLRELRYLCTYHTRPELFVPRVVRGLKAVVDEADARAQVLADALDRKFEPQPLMVTRSQLEPQLGEAVSALLLEWYGAVCTRELRDARHLLMLALEGEPGAEPVPALEEDEEWRAHARLTKGRGESIGTQTDFTLADARYAAAAGPGGISADRELLALSASVRADAPRGRAERSPAGADGLGRDAPKGAAARPHAQGDQYPAEPAHAASAGPARNGGAAADRAATKSPVDGGPPGAAARADGGEHGADPPSRPSRGSEPVRDWADVPARNDRSHLPPIEQQEPAAARAPTPPEYARANGHGGADTPQPSGAERHQPIGASPPGSVRPAEHGAAERAGSPPSESRRREPREPVVRVQVARRSGSGAGSASHAGTYPYGGQHWSTSSR